MTVRSPPDLDALRSSQQRADPDEDIVYKAKRPSGEDDEEEGESKEVLLLCIVSEVLLGASR
jgi:hypothetical protein